ncbi:MAG: transglutaminase family protein [Actinomycetes bacterium]
MRLDIRYRTSFTYDNLVRESQNELRACPCPDDYQQLISYRVVVEPEAKIASFTDYWGTRVDSFGIRQPHVAVEVVAESSVETHPRPQITRQASLAMLEGVTFVNDHHEYLQPSPHAAWGPLVAAEGRRQRDGVGDDVMSLVAAIHRFTGECLTYSPGSTDVGIEVETLLAHGMGVCQDYAHLAVALCRSQGIPARYVSGYLFTRDDSLGLDVEETFDQHFDVVNVQTHAWFEAAVPGHGWISLDPTNHQDVGMRHVKIGHGRDYDDVEPLRGIFSGGSAPSVHPHVEIRRLREPHQVSDYGPHPRALSGVDPAGQHQ